MTITPCRDPYTEEELASQREAVELKRRLLTETQGQEPREIQTAFDPRTEVSADARYIAKRISRTLWIIFVLLPVVLAILYAIVTAK
jgi:hypothetical protein